MNTIEGLKQLPSIVQKLLNERDTIQGQIDVCMKPIEDICKEVFNASHKYVDNVSICEENVSFCMRDIYDQEILDSYSFPIETFVSADTLRKYIDDKKKQEDEAKLAKEEHNKRMAEKALAESERETYEKLKKKFEGT